MRSLLRPLVVCGLLLVSASSPAAEPRPQIVAHRGLLKHAPENTLANFRACLALKLGFEFDVARTRDGELVCLHDDDVERTTDGRGAVAEMTLAELQALDAGSWFAPEFAGERVPTVEQVLQLLAREPRADVRVAVDLKAAGVEAEVVKLAVEVGVLDRLLFIGRTISEPGVRQRIRTAAPQAHTAALAMTADELPAALAAPDADWVYLRFVPTRTQIEQVHRAGKRAFIAGKTVADELPDNWRRAADAGLDGILTDYPLELRGVLKAAATP